MPGRISSVLAPFAHDVERGRHRSENEFERAGQIQSNRSPQFQMNSDEIKLNSEKERKRMKEGGE